MTTYVVHIDDHETDVYPLDEHPWNTVEVPEALEEAFVEFVDDTQPTLATIQRWLKLRA